MQACPYDAIYIDPDTGTAAKCHYCAHRTDIGLEPACVVVCPEQAIIAGDADNPESQIAVLLASQDVTVRKPEQGTAPKVFYIDGSDVNLHPTVVERTPEMFMWADVIPLHSGDNQGAKNGRGFPHQPETDEQEGKSPARAGAFRPPQPQGIPWDGPSQFGGTVAEQMVQVAYNAQHKIPWHWSVPAYLVTKGIAAGIFMILSLGLGLGWFEHEGLTTTVAGFLSLIFVGLTTALLLHDLEKPERFFSIMIRPQWRSWLTRGAFILVGFTMIAGIWWLIEAGAYFDIVTAEVAEGVRPIALWLGLPLAIGMAVYTAYLLAQAEGRDLWQSPLLPFHLVIQAFMAGSGAFLIMALFISNLPDELLTVAWTIFIVALSVDLFVLLVGEFTIPHASEIAARAAHDISHGRYRHYFWWGTIVLGHVIPLILALVAKWVTDSLLVGSAAGLCAIIGLYLYEYAFIMAPQEIPNS